jgi:hypothetical protein
LDEVLAPARVSSRKHSVIMSMRVLVLSSCQTAQAISKMPFVIRVGKSLIVNTKSGQRLILVTWKVMALEDQTLHGSSKSFGFCDCEVIDQVGVQPVGST